MSQVNLISHIYNPANQTPQEIIENFVIREKEFDKIFSDLRNSEMIYPEQHYLILGQRGYGKTTLLLRLHNEIKNDKDLNNRFCSIIFNEEQYNIRRLERLWEQVANYLEEYQGFEKLYDDIIKEEDKPDYEELAFKALEKSLKDNNKKLILLIDNINDIFDKFTQKESQRLREVLLTSSEIRIIGASSKYLEYNFSYDKPFFEFFKVIELKNLNKEETIKLLLKLSDNYHENNVKDIIENKPNKIEALRRITGGVPRTIVLLFEIFADDKEGTSFKDLEVLLDRVTPLYKHRMDDLSPIQQEIVDIIALNWDAVNTKYISQKTRIESKSVSAQLKELEKNKIINKINTSTKNHLYQISERFFNIWYLMRYGRKKDQDKVRWLVEFLESWCNKDDLYKRVSKHIKALKSGNIDEKYALFMTEALAKTKINSNLQHRLILSTREFLELKNSNLKEDLSDSDIELFDKGINLFNKEDFILAIKNLNKIKNKKKSIKSFIESIRKFLVDNNDNMNIFNLGLYFLQLDNIKKSKKYINLALRNDEDLLNNFQVFAFFEFNKNSSYHDKIIKIIKDLDIELLLNSKLIYYYYDFEKRYSDCLYFEQLVKLERFKNNKNLRFLLSSHYFSERKNKLEALKFIENLFNTLEEDKLFNLGVISLYIEILLWNNNIDKSILLMPNFIQKELEIIDDTNYSFIRFTLVFFIAKKQYNYVYNLFQEKEYNLKEHLKPLYYALMFFMKDKYPDEYLKMGSELKETVEEIINTINQIAVDY